MARPRIVGLVMGTTKECWEQELPLGVADVRLKGATPLTPYEK
jgi:hypothetical protein